MLSNPKRKLKTAVMFPIFVVLVIVLSLLAVGQIELNATDEQFSERGESHSEVSTVPDGVHRHRRLQQQYQIETNVVQHKGEIGNIPSNVSEGMDSKLIDFVVGGFPKCGTTYLQNKILYPSDRVFIPHHETHFLQNNMYEEFEDEFVNVTKLQQISSKPLVSGYKSPFELGHQNSLQNLATLFPDVRMIITLRHPVLQFESLYNYKLRKLPELIPPPEEYIGRCNEQCLASSSESSPRGDDEVSTSPQKCVRKELTFCTGQSSYQQFLSRLGLTPMTTPEELDLLDHHTMSIHPFAGWQQESSNNSRSNDQKMIRSPGWNVPVYRREGSSNKNRNPRLFLIELGQFDNRMNQSMADDVNSDLEIFLGLDEGDLPRAPHRPGDKKPKVVYDYPPGREEYILNICLDQYKPLRDVLLESSRKAATWIMEYLLHPSNRDLVMVSNLDIFERMMKGWEIDPCLDENEP